MVRHPALLTLLIAMAIFSSGMLAAQRIAQQRAASAPRAVVHVVNAGGTQPGESSVRFFPDTVRVERGDTVTWRFQGAHNIHFRPAGVTTISLDQNITDGAVYQGGDANSGVRTTVTGAGMPVSFSLIIDLDPGSYAYLCDLHPGMRGLIEVTGTGIEIAST